MCSKINPQVKESVDPHQFSYDIYHHVLELQQELNEYIPVRIAYDDLTAC